MTRTTKLLPRDLRNGDVVTGLVKGEELTVAWVTFPDRHTAVIEGIAGTSWEAVGVARNSKHAVRRVA